MKTPTVSSATSSRRGQISLRSPTPRLPRSSVCSMQDLANPSAFVHPKRFSTPSLTLKVLCAGNLNRRKDKIAIVDETPVIHARPVAMGPNIALAKELGADPNKELQAFLRLLRAHAPLRYLGRDHQRRTLYDGPLRARSFQGRAR